MPLDPSPVAQWNITDCAECPLDLEATLSSGQAFRWRRDAFGIWWGTIESSAVALWQARGNPGAPLRWQTFPRPDERRLVEDYFRMDVQLEQLYTEWIRAEPAIYAPIQAFRGLRILRQPPVECFFAFQCATCNTVVKIERSVHRLAERYGKAIRIGNGTSTGHASASTDHPPDLASAAIARGSISDFPTIDALAMADESELRSDLWGYRAPRLISLARHVRDRGADWLTGLRALPYPLAKQALVELYGIGEKVADCICLFCLDKDEAVPVDTHVRQIACRTFLPELGGKSMTTRVYHRISDAYRARFGNYAGWAQQYLFLGAMRSRGR